MQQSFFYFVNIILGRGGFDQYSYLHFTTGVVAQFWDMSLIVLIILHTIFEIIENREFSRKFITKYLTFWPGGKSYADSVLNSFTDTVFAVIGWLSASYFRKYMTKK